MAHKAARGKAAASTPSPSTSSSSPTVPTPTSSSSSPSSAVPPPTSSTAPTPPTSAWGKAKPLLGSSHGQSPAMPASLPTANGADNAAEKGAKEKEKEKTAAAAPASSPSSPTPPVTSPASASSPAAVPAATAPAASASVPATVSAAVLAGSLQLGCVVRVTTSLNEVLEGVVWVFDAGAHLLALELPSLNSASPPSYSMLNTAALTQVDLIRRPSPNSSPHPSTPRVLPEVDHGKLAQKEARAVAQRQVESSKIGIGVTARGQRMFDALSKLYGAVWQGSSIVLMDSIRLDEPYTAEHLTGGSSQQRQRIIKTIQHRNSIEQQQSDTTPQNNTTQHK